MSSQREHFELWVRDFLQPRYPELVSPLSKSLEAFDAAQKTGALTEAQVQVVLQSARSPRKLLGENVAALLGELAAQYPEAERAVREMSADPRAHVRVNALVAISATMPGALHDEILRTALRDRSSRIRTLAADKIMQFGLRSLLPELKEAIARERDPEIRATLERECNLLRDGYHQCTKEDGRVWLSCRSSDGAVKSTFVTTAELQRRGARAVAKSFGADVGEDDK